MEVSWCIGIFQVPKILRRSYCCIKAPDKLIRIQLVSATVKRLIKHSLVLLMNEKIPQWRLRLKDLSVIQRPQKIDTEKSGKLKNVT